MKDVEASETQYLKRATIWLMAVACGVSAANIFYNQPLLGDFAAYFNVSPSMAGLVATAAQVGYGLGLFFFVPLGDLLERRRIVLLLVNLCTLVLVVTAFSPNLPWLIVCHLLIGITTMSAQILIPFGIEMTPKDQRGKTVGTLMAGLLCGVLLARVISGFVADYFGWRFMYGMAAGIMLTLSFALRAGLPHRAPVLKMSYVKMMQSMFVLWSKQPALWRGSLISGLSFGCFTAFWTALSFLMIEQFHRGASEAGLFGVVGLAGALAAPLAGKISDRKGPAFTVTLSLVAIAASFGLMWAWVTIPSLIIGILFMDLGVQSIQVAEQTKVISLVPDAGSRLNTFYMVFRFIGGAGGSVLGASSWSWARWPGVCGAVMILVAAASLLHFWGAWKSKQTSTFADASA